jgi:hypothetical protein
MAHCLRIAWLNQPLWHAAHPSLNQYASFDVPTFIQEMEGYVLEHLGPNFFLSLFPQMRDFLISFAFLQFHKFVFHSGCACDLAASIFGPRVLITA